MRAALTIATLVLSAPLLLSPARAETLSINYSALELLEPCQESDNDSRWGDAAETECEQYVMGFIGALSATGQLGSESGICLPQQNIADEARWAYMRWVHASYTARKTMPAAQALLATLTEAFPCK